MQAYSETIIVKLKRLQFNNTLTNLIHLYKHLIENINNTDSRVGEKITLLKRKSRIYIWWRRTNAVFTGLMQMVSNMSIFLNYAAKQNGFHDITQIPTTFNDFPVVNVNGAQNKRIVKNSIKRAEEF